MPKQVTGAIQSTGQVNDESGVNIEGQANFAGGTTFYVDASGNANFASLNIPGATTLAMVSATTLTASSASLSAVTLGNVTLTGTQSGGTLAPAAMTGTIGGSAAWSGAQQFNGGLNVPTGSTATLANVSATTLTAASASLSAVTIGNVTLTGTQNGGTVNPTTGTVGGAWHAGAGVGTPGGDGTNAVSYVIGGNLNGATSLTINPLGIIAWNASGSGAEINLIAQQNATASNPAFDVRTITGSPPTWGISPSLMKVDRSGNLTAAGAISSNTPLQSFAGTTAGTVSLSMPFRGSAYKKVLAYLSGYENDTATAQSLSFPVAFTDTPAVVTNNTGISAASISVSTTALSLNPDSATAFTGWIIVEGF